MGYTFRSGLEDEAQGAMRVIQTKDLGDDGIVAHDSLFRTTLSVPQAQRVRAGDIVVRSRGGKATSALVASDPGDTVVAAPLLRVRVTDPRVTPAYLNWYINQPPTQAYLAKRAEGTHMKMISKIMLEGLPVLVPSAARQERIIRLAGLSARERILSVELLALREKLRSAIMSEYAWGANGGAETERPRRGSR
ncbi:MAG: restriction endonuclease subunit S [Actinobacteria bacterium]|nr:restriction endonuclease subunit S [Actinomycetota bacterium]